MTQIGGAKEKASQVFPELINHTEKKERKPKESYLEHSSFLSLSIFFFAVCCISGPLTNFVGTRPEGVASIFSVPAELQI